VDGHLVRHGRQRERLDWLAQQHQIREVLPHGATRRVGKCIGGGIESDREGVRSCARHVERITPVSRAVVDGRSRERAGELRDLTDVDVEEALTDEPTHEADATAAARRGRLFLSRGIDRFVRVLHQALRTADGARDIETAVEIAQVLGGFQGFLEGGFRKAQRGAQTLKLALIHLALGHPPRMLASVSLIERMRTVRQIRQYANEPVPEDVTKQLLRVAQWTGSSRNTQPWHFVVVSDKEQLRRISQLRPPINWLATAPLGIAIVLESAGVSEAYDEGRVTERLLIAAHSLGYGAGVAWFGDDTHQTEAKRILGIPAERTARSIVMIGRPTSTKDPRPTARLGGRKPLSEIVSYERYGGGR
jgi:nitroreductase